MVPYPEKEKVPGGQINVGDFVGLVVGAGVVGEVVGTEVVGERDGFEVVGERVGARIGSGEAVSLLVTLMLKGSPQLADDLAILLVWM